MKTFIYIVTVTEKINDNTLPSRINYIVEARDVAHAFEKVNSYIELGHEWIMEVYISSFDYMKSESLHGVVTIV
jgi:hypothetical protein